MSADEGEILIKFALMSICITTCLETINFTEHVRCFILGVINDGTNVCTKVIVMFNPW